MYGAVDIVLNGTKLTRAYHANIYLLINLSLTDISKDDADETKYPFCESVSRTL